MIELTVENKKYQDEAASLKSEVSEYCGKYLSVATIKLFLKLEEMRKQIEEQQEQLRKKDEQLSQQGLSSTKETVDKKHNTGVASDDVEDESKKDDQQYVNIDTSSGDVKEKKEGSKEDEKSDAPKDNAPEYVNVSVDDEGENKEVENEEQVEEDDEVHELDQVVKTETITSTSQLTRAKVGNTLKRKPPSRGLIRRTAEESGSQENLFETAATSESDYVNMAVNTAVIQQPTPKAEESNIPQKEDNKPSDLDAAKDDKSNEVIITYFVTDTTLASFIGS